MPSKAGLTAYASHKVSRYTLMNLGNSEAATRADGDGQTTQTPLPSQIYTEHEVYAGGELAKREGNLLHYRINGEGAATSATRCHRSTCATTTPTTSPGTTT